MRRLLTRGALIGLTSRPGSSFMKYDKSVYLKPVASVQFSDKNKVFAPPVAHTDTVPQGIYIWINTVTTLFESKQELAKEYTELFMKDTR